MKPGDKVGFRIYHVPGTYIDVPPGMIGTVASVDGGLVDVRIDAPGKLGETTWTFKASDLHQVGVGKVYVAGPMRGYPEFNFPTFDAVAAEMHARGWTVANPAEHDREVYPEMESWPGYETGDVDACPGFDFHAAMSWDLAQVASADAIVLLPGWEQSSGAGHERYVAEVCGKRIFLATPSADGGWNIREDEVQVRVLVGMRLREDLATIGTPTPTGGEVRVIDPTTGGAKGQKLARFDLLPWDALWVVAEHFGRGAQKYEERNWERGYAWSLSHGALHRHLAAFWNGEDIDEETGGPHLAAVAFHALALLSFLTRAAGTDDRPLGLRSVA